MEGNYEGVIAHAGNGLCFRYYVSVKLERPAHRDCSFVGERNEARGIQAYRDYYGHSSLER